MTQDRGFYKKYCCMTARSGAKKGPHFKTYGLRGIKCEWKTFKDFETDMYDSYVIRKKELGNDIELDRIDVNGNYKKENCRWISHKENNNNRTNNRILNFNGKSQSMSKWADEFCISYSVMEGRIRRGWSMEKIFLTPVAFRRK